VPVDYQESYFWSVLASKNNHTLAVQLRPQIAEQLSQKQRVSIEGRANSWMPKKPNAMRSDQV